MEHKKLIAGLLVAVAGAVLRGPETECLTNPWGVPCRSDPARPSPRVILSRRLFLLTGQAYG